MKHIWTLDNWENILPPEQKVRNGIRIRFDAGIDPEIRRACKEFLAYLRREYYFPIRVVIYVKNKKKLICQDGNKAFGTFWRIDDDFSTEPYIRIAVGDYDELCEKWDKESALTVYIGCIAHELTHYFQWVNGLQLTTRGEERQATMYSRYIVWDYTETRERI